MYAKNDSNNKNGETDQQLFDLVIEYKMYESRFYL